MKKIDYSDELSDLKEIHEDNIGRRFSDEDFNRIFEIALKSQPDLYKIADRFQSDMMGLLMTLDEATHQWEKEKLVNNVKGDPKKDIEKLMADLKGVIEYFASRKNPNWGDVATLANIHESLGEQLFEKYDKHTGYSRSIEEGMKRHTEASQNLWLQAKSEVEKLDPIKHLPDLVRWKNFFSDLLEGFVGLLKNKNPEKNNPKHSSDPWFNKIKREDLDPFEQRMYDDFKKHGHGYALQLIINSVEGDYSQLSKKLAKVAREQDKGLKGMPETEMLRQEAIELAEKLNDKELAKYLEKAPYKAIQRRIKALREEAIKKK